MASQEGRRPRRAAHAERLGASFEDGVLTITIPRTEAAKPRQLAIED
jgi:HSP20 family molecular chaperone IbpA